MKYYETIKEINDHFKLDTKHPLIDIRKYSDIIAEMPLEINPFVCGFYKISFVKNFDGFMQFDKTKITGKNGILYFVAPGEKFS